MCAVIGGVTGAALGKAVGGDDRSAIIGGVAGAVIGGAIGQNMARQERELNQQLAGSGAWITNTGSQLCVILPESVTFPTGSAVVDTGFLPALRQIAKSLRDHGIMHRTCARIGVFTGEGKVHLATSRVKGSRDGQTGGGQVGQRLV